MEPCTGEAPSFKVRQAVDLKLARCGTCMILTANVGHILNRGNQGVLPDWDPLENLLLVFKGIAHDATQ